MANRKRYTEAHMSAVGAPPRCPLCGSRVVAKWVRVSRLREEPAFTPVPQACRNAECDLSAPGPGVDWGREWRALMYG